MADNPYVPDAGSTAVDPCELPGDPSRELQVVMDNAGVGIALVRQRRIVRCNQKYAEIYGYASTRNMLGRTSETLYPDETSFRALGDAAYPVMAGGIPYKSEVLMKRLDGSLFWTHLTGTLVDPRRPDHGSIWIVDDIDDYKLARSEFHALLAQQTLILDNAMVGIVFLRERTVTQCNRAFEQLFGYEPGGLDGKSTRQWYLSEDDWLQAGRTCYEPLAAGGVFHGEMLLARKDGSPIMCEVRAKAIDPQRLELGSIWITMDITARKQAEVDLRQARTDLERLVERRTEELSRTVLTLEYKIAEQITAEARIARLAHFDVLTGLPNRALLEDRCAHALGIARRSGHSVVLMFLDLDHFKSVNDSLGHRVGDAVLVELSERLRRAVRQQDTVARLGGDEFVLLLPETDADGAAMLAAKLLATCNEPFQVEQHELTVTPSIGIALFPRDGADLNELSRCADAAMYKAKENGRRGYCFFTSEIRARTDSVLQLGNAMRRALAQGQFHLHFQPQFAIRSGTTIGVEALLRWQHPEFGSVSPAQFIPIAENTGLVVPIGEWVIRNAVQQLAAWMGQGMPAIRMSVNLSAVQFRHAELPARISAILDEAQVPAHLLQLELTESAAMQNPRNAVATINDLNRRGVLLAIDDFGTGYSSLSYLKQFRVAKLKIDQSFVHDITDDADNRAIVSAIISMADSLDIETIAEGVETEGQLAFLRARGCTEAQGYLFSRPLPASQFEAFMREDARVLQ